MLEWGMKEMLVTGCEACGHGRVGDEGDASDWLSHVVMVEWEMKEMLVTG